MKCIFCKSTTNPFTSVEHIIPESIGNKEHILPKGIVCDPCNNYFSRKVENKFINSEVLLHLRNKMEIPNRDKRIPKAVTSNLLKIPDQRCVARFLGKVAIEVLTQRALTGRVPNWEVEIIENEGLDLLRNFVHFNKFKGDWLFYHRTLHPVNALFQEGIDYFETLHEFDLLYTTRNELYLILSIFGVEFTINFGGAVIDGYLEWLVQNNYKSPLYSNSS